MGASSTKTATATGSHTTTIAHSSNATAISPDLPRRRLAGGSGSGSPSEAAADPEIDTVGHGRSEGRSPPNHPKGIAKPVHLASNLSVKAGLAAAVEDIHSPTGDPNAKRPDPRVERDAVEDYMTAVKKMLEKGMPLSTKDG